MFNENQLVKVTWENRNRKYYESKGYLFTNYRDEFVVKAKDLSKGSRAIVQVTCDFCGDNFNIKYQNYYHHEDKNLDACPRCRALKQYANSREKRAKKVFDRLREICDENGYELVTKESDFTDEGMNIEFICPHHGLQTMMLSNFMSGHKCRACSYEERGREKRHSKEYVKSIIEQFNGNEWLNPDDYIGSNEHNLQIRCGICGDVYTTSFSDYTVNHQIRCSHCSKSESIGEYRIRTFLEDNDIEFIQEKKFDDCKDVYQLPFDFYLPTYNLIIEFDGQFHFEPIYGEDRLLLTQTHDIIKNNYCKSKGIDLLRIPYWDGNDIEKIIANKLNINIGKRYSLVS